MAQFSAVEFWLSLAVIAVGAATVFAVFKFADHFLIANLVDGLRDIGRSILTRTGHRKSADKLFKNFRTFTEITFESATVFGTNTAKFLSRYSLSLC